MVPLKEPLEGDNYGSKDTDIPAGVQVETSQEQGLNSGLDGAVVEANNLWRKIEKGNWGDPGPSMLTTYTQVENVLELSLRHS